MNKSFIYLIVGIALISLAAATENNTRIWTASQVASPTTGDSGSGGAQYNTWNINVNTTGHMNTTRSYTNISFTVCGSSTTQFQALRMGLCLHKTNSPISDCVDGGPFINITQGGSQTITAPIGQCAATDFMALPFSFNNTVNWTVRFVMATSGVGFLRWTETGAELNNCELNGRPLTDVSVPTLNCAGAASYNNLYILHSINGSYPLEAAPVAPIDINISINNTNPMQNEWVNIQATFSASFTSAKIFDNYTKVNSTVVLSANRGEYNFSVPYMGMSVNFTMYGTSGGSEYANSTLASSSYPIFKTIVGNQYSWNWQNLSCNSATGIRSGSAISWTW